MTHRERLSAVFHYEPYDALPVIHFGFLDDTLANWAAEGHVTQEEARGWADSNPVDLAIEARLGFVVTPSSMPSSLASRISSRFAVSIKNFMKFSFNPDLRSFHMFSHMFRCRSAVFRRLPCA